MSEGNVLKELTENRLLIFAGIEYVEKTAFSVLVAHNGAHVVDEIFEPYTDAKAVVGRVYELTQTYSKYTSDLIELQTDNRDLMRLAATTAGLHVKPTRKKDIELFTRRTLARYAEDRAIYELYDITPLEPPRKRSQWRTWLINALLGAALKLEGDERL
jgi:hypothetical protein